jgi:hypothetical protein
LRFSPSPAPILRVALTALLLPAFACAGDRPAPAEPAAGKPAAAPPAPASSPESAFVVWESNRSGAYRIWRQELAGGAPRLLSPDEPGRDHCCAKLSPDGRRLVYLSLPGGARQYSLEPGVLHLVDSDGGRDRVLAAEARHYGEHRAAVWWGEDELVYLDGANATRALRLSTGESRVLATQAPGAEGWLIAPGGRIASGGTPTFSDYEEGKGVQPRPTLGGCQPAFSNDGRFGVWSAGAGGPIDALDLATRRSWTLLDKGDARLPPGRTYLYFPMLSNDNSLLALGASAGEHHHFRADYDIYVVELDPRTLQPAGRALAIAPHPGVDRFPDLFRTARSGPGPAPQSPAGGGTAEVEAPPAAGGNLTAGRLFLWRSADAENRASPGGASEILRAHGPAWIDRHRALALGGGFYRAEDATAQRLFEGLVARNQFSLALLVTPASLSGQGVIAALSDGPRARSLALRQEGAEIVLVLRTSESSREGVRVPLGRLDSAKTHHLLVTFSPGRLRSVLNGTAGAASALPGDFFHWRARGLTFGAEGQGAERWHGTLRDISIWNRPLADGEIAGEVARVRALLAAEPAVERAVVEARLRTASPPPALEEISPYREALAVDELEVVRQIAGPPIAGGTIRVARWAILDGQVLAAPAAGALRRVVVEPFSAQPQLEPFFVSDRLPVKPGTKLYFDLGATASP